MRKVEKEYELDKRQLIDKYDNICLVKLIVK